SWPRPPPARLGNQHPRKLLRPLRRLSLESCTLVTRTPKDARMAEPAKSNKKLIFTVLITVVLLALVYLQFREWRKFDWNTFLEQIRTVRVPRVIAGIAIIYGGYVLRSIRWAV